MKSKGFSFLFLGLTVVFLSSDVFGLAARRPAVSMLVVPARYTIVQVGNDISAHRPCVMVSYNDMDMGGLFVWDGAKWIGITPSDLAAANFVRIKPSRVILVGSREDLGGLVDSLAWCEDIVFIEDMRTTALLNRLGRIFNFSDAEWRWFASRYGCELNINNREEVEGSWYDQSREEFLAKEAALQAAKEIDLPPADTIDAEPMEELEPVDGDAPADDMSGQEMLDEQEPDADVLEIEDRENEDLSPAPDIEAEEDMDEIAE